jgi:hypothetical protein
MPHEAQSEVTGIIIELVGDVLTVIGLTGQRFATLRAESAGKGFRPCFDPAWIVAFLIYAAGQVLELVALGFASESTVVAIGNLTLIFNAFASVWVFGEEFAWFPRTKSYLTWKIFKDWDGFNLMLLVVGTVLTVLYSPLVSEDEEESFDAKELEKMWFDAPFVYFSFIASCALIAFAFQACMKWYNIKTFIKTTTTTNSTSPTTSVSRSLLMDNNNNNNGNDQESGIISTSNHHPNINGHNNSAPVTLINTSFRSTATSDGNTSSTSLLQPSNTSITTTTTIDERPQPFRVACVLAVLASFSVTMSKVVTELFSRAQEGEKNQFLSFGSMCMIILWLISLVVQIIILNIGLRDYEQSMFIPLAETMSASFTILAGLLYFKTYNDFHTPGHIIGFSFGAILLCIGLFLSSRRHAPTKEEIHTRLMQHSPRSHFESLTSSIVRSASQSNLLFTRNQQHQQQPLQDDDPTNNHHSLLEENLLTSLNHNNTNNNNS